MITIEGLTARQKSIMDLLWSCDSLEQAQGLIKNLPTQADQYDALSLINIAAWEVMEAEGAIDECEDQARSVIRNAASH
jgi:hypothetical protein